jgi:ketosteroid isomerase-like protein
MIATCIRTTYWKVRKMSIGKALLTLFCLLLALSTGAQTGDNNAAGPEEAKLVALERMWNQAQLTRDSGALKSIISERFVSTEWDGVVSNHSQFLAEIADPRFKPSVMSVQDLKIEFYGSTAIVVGVYHTKGIYNGKPYEHVGRFTDTWVREASAWKCVASHTSLIQKQNS